MTVHHMHDTSASKPRRRNRRLMLFSVVLLIVLAACTRGTQGIFATIEQEEETATSNLVDDATIVALVRAEVGTETRFVAIAETEVYSRLETSSDWSEISAPSGRLAQFLSGIDSDSDGTVDEVYAVFQNVDSSDTDLFALQSDRSWSEVDLSGSGVADGDMITGLFSVGDELLMSVRDAGYSSGEIPILRLQSGPTLVNTITGFNDDIRDGIVSDADDLYIVGRSNLVAKVDAATPTVADALTGSSPGIKNAAGVGYRSIADGGPLIAVVDTDANVYLSDGTNWQTISSGLDRSFSDIEWVPEIGTDGAFVVGTWSGPAEDTNRDGYYHALITAGSSVAAEDYAFSFADDLGSNYNGSTLSISGVNQFRYFDNGLLFVLTFGRGLWRTTYVDGASDPGDFTWE